MSKITGNRPTVLIVDEINQFRSTDYAKLEEHLLAHGYSLIQTAFDENGEITQEYLGIADTVMQDGTLVDIKTGRRQSEPELQSLWPRRLGKSVLQQDIYTMIAEQTERSREEVKDLYFPHAYGTGRFFGGLQQVPRKPEKSRYFSSPYAVNNHGADHPSRKREPKGPRGKWGKL